MSITKMLQEKKIYKQNQKRVNNFPKDYQIVYGEILKYLYKVGPVELDKDNKIIYDLIDFFDQAIVDKKDVLEVTGEDVASFVDELIKDMDTHTDNAMKKVNSKINKKYKK